MSEGTIKFSCDCGKAYKVPDKYAGKRVRCKECGETVAVPSASEQISSARAAAVSQRSVMTSKRLSAEDDGTVRVPPKAAPKLPGGDTRVVDLKDLQPEMKKYVRKRDEEMAKGTGKLVLFTDGKAVKSFRLDKEARTLGRGSDNDIQIDDKSVSKKHLKIEYMMGMFIATDTQSTNGLVVNGKKVRRVSLKDGDVIQLGDVVLRLDCGK